MRRRLTPARLLIGLACLFVFESVLSVAGYHFAGQAKARLEQAFPGQQVKLTGAAWITADCGTFRFGGEAADASHRFLAEDNRPLETDLTAADPEAFDTAYRACRRFHRGRGDWQDPIFDAVVLPRL